MNRLIIAVLLGLLMTASCGLLKKKPKVILPDKSVRLAGRVERVETTSNYVLIRRYGPWQFDPATEVAESRGAERTANLLPTGEKLGEHIAADIRSGAVEVGDAVYIRRIKASQKPETSENQEKPSEPDNQSEPPTNP